MRKYLQIFTIGFCFLAVSCEEALLETYKSGKRGVYFNVLNEEGISSNERLDSTIISFADLFVDTVRINIPIAVLGAMSDQADQVIYEVVADSTTASKDIHYNILTSTLVVDPGKTEAILAMDVYRDTSLLENDYSIYIRLKENESFKPEPTEEVYDKVNDLSIDLENHVVMISGKLLPPPDRSWNYGRYFGDYSTKKHLLINKLCGITSDDWEVAMPDDLMAYWIVTRNYLDEMYHKGTPIMEDPIAGEEPELMRVLSVNF